MIGTVFQIIDALINLKNKGKLLEVDASKSILTVAETQSLVDVAKLARVEPLAIVSKDCLTLDYLPDVMTTLLNIFIGYYMQAVSIGGRVDSIKVIKTLDRLNPDRDLTGWLMASSLESLRDHTVMNANEYEYRLPRSIALEATASPANPGNPGKPPKQDPYNKLSQNTTAITQSTTLGAEVDPQAASGSVRDPGKILSETANLAVGKVINIEINVNRNQTERTDRVVGGQTTTIPKQGDTLYSKTYKTDTDSETTSSIANSTMTIPVMVRLSPSLLPTNSILKILTQLTEEDTFVERFHAWRSGRIGFIRDLILCQDMIDEHRKALMNDEQGTYSEIMRRVNNSRKYGMLTQNPSLATASNLFVITQDVALQVEQKLGGKLSNPKVREKAFASTYAMIIAVIDTRYNRVIFYHRGISAPTDVSIRELSQASKGKGPDIMDIFKAYQLGNAPSY